MKKAFFAGIAVLAALVMMTCDLFPSIETGGSKNDIVYDENGQPLVELTIKTGGASRALTSDLAKSGADFFEVAFKDGTKVYRASWDYTQTGRIRVPLKAYTGAAEAILFAGRQSDKTLLAVGIATSLNGTPLGTAGTFTVTAATTTLTFTLNPLVTDVHGRPQDGDPSSFVITQTGFVTATVYEDDPLPYAKFIDKDIPIFEIATTASTATLTLATATGSFSTYNPGMNTLEWEANDVIRIAGVSTADYSANSPVIPLPAAAITTPATHTIPVPAVIGITFTPDAATTTGLFKFALALPLSAISDNDFPITWYIRGGLQNGLYDEGSSKVSIGGSILLSVGKAIDGLTIIIAP
jgi:hypothetical protein